MLARDNPFNAQKLLTVRYRLAGTTWDELLARLAGLGFRAALIGPKGHGKTTLLEDLASRLREQGYSIRTVTLHTGDRRLTPAQKQTLFHGLTGRDLLVLDGAEQLGRLGWMEVRLRSRQAGGLLVTSHRPGLLPTLYECRTTPELLARLLNDLLGAEAEPLGPTPEELFARHQGNLREALGELYDRFAGRCSSVSPSH